MLNEQGIFGNIWSREPPENPMFDYPLLVAVLEKTSVEKRPHTCLRIQLSTAVVANPRTYDLRL